MKTLQEIKNEILATNPEQTYTLNDEILPLSDEDFAHSIDERAKMVLEQWIYEENQANIKALKISAYEKLGITADEAALLLRGN
jgi:hypothetical protein